MAEASISGIYEVCIGTTDADSLIKYWQQFGYKVGETGAFSMDQALKLYNVRSKLKSIRLHHQDADHGLVRLFVWESPSNEGLQLSGMKIIGNRWSLTLTNNIHNLENHAEEAVEQRMPIHFVPSVRGEIYKLKQRPVPFIDTYPLVREMCLLQPLSRQIFFQRFAYDLPLFGRIDENSFFQTSQFTNVGMVIYENDDHLRFYDETLGLLRSHHGKPQESTYDDYLTRMIVGLEKDESCSSTYFDDPRSSTTDLQKVRSGRLKILRFPQDIKLENKLQYSNPGSLGYSLYTLRVTNINFFYDKVQRSNASNITEICSNEFGETSFSFVAPDGYFWSILELKVTDM